MLKTLFVYYDKRLSQDLKHMFESDFKIADKILLVAVVIFSITVAFVTSLQHGYYLLGMVGGGVISTVCIIAYNTIAGSIMCRIIMATALACLLAITVQQSHGLGEGHFLFFLGFTILIRYRDILPLLLFVTITVVHHLSLTYCQSIGVEVWGQAVLIYSWGENSEWGLLAPLVYHVIFALLSLVVSTYYIYEGNIKFVESNLVISAVEKAAEGDLSSKIDNEGVDSLLVAHVNSFLQRLHNIFSQIDQVTDTLTSQANDTSSLAKTRVSQASSQQSEVLQVATAVSEMAISTQQIAGNAEQTALASTESVQTSENGGKLANTCQQSITELSKQVTQASEIISELDRNGQQISSIVQTIKGIAEQTNLLALNAAIEAARAGEQGRGFAVVADEIRVLSQRTHSSTEEITTMISVLEVSTASAVQTMGGCHELASTSVDDAHKAAQSFDEITGAVKNISNMATQIATAAEEQTSVTEEINRNTLSISDVSKLFLKGAEKGISEATLLQDQARKIGVLMEGFQFR